MKIGFNFTKKFLIFFNFLFLVIIFSLFIGCNSYIIQNIIGNPTKHLDTYNKNFTVILEYKPDYVFSKLKSYFYENQADVYKVEQFVENSKNSKGSKIYVRNLSKIFKNVNITTDLCLNIVADKNDDKNTVVKIVSLNYELAEYLKDVLKDILQAQEQKEKELEIKRSETLNQSKDNSVKDKDIIEQGELKKI